MMDRTEVLNRVIEICKEVFENEDLVLDENSCAENVEQWDSLTHLAIISDLEEEYNISFSLDEMVSVKNLGQLVDVVMKS